MDRRHRRALIASAVGSALEWYDFFIYGTAAALVFGRLFFPKSEPAIGTLLAFVTFGVGFVARPLGGAVFGHLGDRLGRRPVLVMTLLLVGGGTFLIGLVPTYESIGFAAPLLLVLLRLVQGFGAGAEYGGAVLLAVEHAPDGKRGLYGSVAPMGVTVGILLANAVFALVGMLPDADFLSWGWRVPFLLSLLLIFFGIYVRLKVSETPAFEKVAASRKTVRWPVLDAVRRHPREFLVVIGARMAENGLGYLFPVFALNYITQQLKLPRGVGLTGNMIAYTLQLIAIPLFSALADRIGRRPVYMGGALFSAAFAFPFFMLVNTLSAPLIWLALSLGIAVGVGAMFGAQAAYFAELFSTSTRYSGFAFARELGSILAGGLAPPIAAALLIWQGGEPWAVAAYMTAMALITAVAVYYGPETYRSDIHLEKTAA
jgi:metabolite-proton symporter